MLGVAGALGVRVVCPVEIRQVLECEQDHVFLAPEALVHLYPVQETKKRIKAVGPPAHVPSHIVLKDFSIVLGRFLANTYFNFGHAKLYAIINITFVFI